jgi:hypothetical protein
MDRTSSPNELSLFLPKGETLKSRLGDFLKLAIKSQLSTVMHVSTSDNELKSQN